MSKQPYPYYTTEVDPSKTHAEIQMMLYDNGAEAVRLTTSKDGQTELEFAYPILREGKRVYMAFRVRPPIMLKMVGRGNNRREVKNLPATARLLYHWLKAKLAAIKWGMRSVEEEFLAEIVARLPSGEAATVGEIFIPQLVTGKFLDPAGLAKQLPPPEVEE